MRERECAAAAGENCCFFFLFFYTLAIELFIRKKVQRHTLSCWIIIRRALATTNIHIIYTEKKATAQLTRDLKCTKHIAAANIAILCQTRAPDHISAYLRYSLELIIHAAAALGICVSRTHTHTCEAL